MRLHYLQAAVAYTVPESQSISEGIPLGALAARCAGPARAGPVRAGPSPCLRADTSPDGPPGSARAITLGATELSGSADAGFRLADSKPVTDDPFWLAIGAFLTSPGFGGLMAAVAAYIAYLGVRHRLRGDKQIAQDAAAAARDAAITTDSLERWCAPGPPELR